MSLSSSGRCAPFSGSTIQCFDVFLHWRLLQVHVLRISDESARVIRSLMLTFWVRESFVEFFPFSDLMVLPDPVTTTSESSRCSRRRFVLPYFAKTSTFNP